MGIGLRVFFVLNESDRLQRISLKRFDGLWGDSKERFPEYAGQSMRYALVILETQNRKPNAITSIYTAHNELRIVVASWRAGEKTIRGYRERERPRPPLHAG